MECKCTTHYVHNNHMYCMELHPSRALLSALIIKTRPAIGYSAVRDKALLRCLYHGGGEPHIAD